MQRWVGTAALVVVGLILIKDGTFGTLASDAARGLTDFGKGIKPVTGIA